MKKVRSEDKKKKTSMVAGEVKREARKRRYWNWEGVTQARASKGTGLAPARSSTEFPAACIPRPTDNWHQDKAV